MPGMPTPFQRLLEIDHRCRSLAVGLPSQRQAVQTWGGIGFRMGGRLFVAPMGEVVEVLHEPRQTLLPGVKQWVRGGANVRGRLLPVMDLCGYFGLELHCRSPQSGPRRIRGGCPMTMAGNGPGAPFRPGCHCLPKPVAM